MSNLNSENGPIDPKYVSQDIKLILKVFDINKIKVKPFLVLFSYFHIFL